MHHEQKTATRTVTLAGPWVEEPGSTGEQIMPPHPNLLKTMPGHLPTLEGPLPTLPELTAKNERFLEIQSGLMADRWMMVCGLAIMFPMLCAAIVAIFFVLYLGPSFFGFPYYIVITLSIPCVYFGVVFVLLCFNFVFAAYKDEPARFSRIDKKVYVYMAKRKKIFGAFMPMPTWGKAELKVYDWANIRGEIERHMVFNGKTARRESFLELAVIDPQTGRAIERFRVGDRSLFGDFAARVVLWETIRRFMEEGPENTPASAVQTNRGTLLDNLDECNMLTYATTQDSIARTIIATIGAIATLPISALFIGFGLCQWIAAHTGRTINWGELDHTIFKRSPDDPYVKQDREKAQSLHEEWQHETRRRRISVLIWLVVAAMDVYGVLWFFGII